jgi:hypothetical protein
MTHMLEPPESLNPPVPSVTVWEVIAIAAGSVLLVAMGAVGLVYKFFLNAANPQRATQIASSLMEYHIPGAEGVFGANLGGAKVAIVGSPSFPKDAVTISSLNPASAKGVELFVARVPLDVETTLTQNTNQPPTSNISPSYDPFSASDFSFSYRSGEEFQVNQERVEEKMFCQQKVPVRIQEGNLTLSNQAPPIAAVKFDASAPVGNSKRQITITAIGPTAKQDAAKVFDSLKCRQSLG